MAIIQKKSEEIDEHNYLRQCQLSMMEGYIQRQSCLGHSRGKLLALIQDVEG